MILLVVPFLKGSRINRIILVFLICVCSCWCGLKSSAKEQFFLSCFLCSNNREGWKEVWLIANLDVVKTSLAGSYLSPSISSFRVTILEGLQEGASWDLEIPETRTQMQSWISIVAARCVYVYTRVHGDGGLFTLLWGRRWTENKSPHLPTMFILRVLSLFISPQIP